MKPVISLPQKAKREPPDGGEGWLVVAGAVFPLIIVCGFSRVIGIIYLAVIDNFKVTRTEANVVFMTWRLSVIALTFVASKLVAHYKYSTIISSAGFLMFLGLFTASFSTSLWHLALSFGILTGAAIPMSLTPGILAIGVYFEKRRSFAMSLYFATGAMGGLLIPFLFEFLLKNHGLSGLFLVSSAIALNICPLAFLIHQPYWLKKSKEVALLPKTKRSPSTDVKDFISSLSLKPKDSFLINILNGILSSTKRDIKIFKNPLFLLQLFSRLFSLMPVFVFLQFVPDFVEREMDVGISKTDVAMVLAMTCVGDVLSRLIVGVIVDNLPWHKKHSFGGLSAIVGVVMFAILFANNFGVLLAINVTFGLLMGSLVVLQFVLEADLMTADTTALAHGITQMFVGVGAIVMMIAVGYFRDVTGSYVIGFCLMGVSGLLGGVVWFLEPCLLKCLPLPVTEQSVIKKLPEEEEKIIV